MSTTLVVDAPAKINLFLRVLGRRPDGYHDIETLFQSVSLADELSITVDESGSAEEHLDVVGPDLGPIESNLAMHAARGFREISGLEAEVRIVLRKRIPAGAGLGGGSSDAAAVLRGLAQLTSYDDIEALQEVASRLGSDVAFFLSGAALSVGRGRGEALTPLRALPARSVVLSLPPVHVSTPEAYRELAGARSALESPGVGTHRVGLPSDADLRKGLSWAEVEGLADNDFERVIATQHPQIEAGLEGLRAEGASLALLSGSGSASFGLFDHQDAARDAARSLERRLGWPHVIAATRTEPPRPTTASPS